MKKSYEIEELHSDDTYVFVPEEEIKAIKTIYDKMERAKQEFNKSKIKRDKKLIDDSL